KGDTMYKHRIGALGIVALAFATPAGATRLGEEWVARWDDEWHHGDTVNAMQVDADGNVYVTGTGGRLSSYEMVTIKYDATGLELWESRLERLSYGAGHDVDRARAIAIDVAGNVYVTGYSGTTRAISEITTLQYDNQGAMTWLATYYGVGAVWTFNQGVDLGLDAANNLYVAGWSVGDGTLADFATIKYSA